MKSSRNRSRSKGNRNRSVGNIVNRVFDSSGPEGKVRGTPQQIIDKYNQLTRDAQLSGDRVAAENFQQHAEHYLRMLSEAQREQDAKREQQLQQQQHNANQQNAQTNQNTQSPQHDQNSQNPQTNQQPRQGGGSEGGQSDATSGGTDFDAVIDTKQQDDGGLVETPESTPKPRRSRNRNRNRPAEDQPQPRPESQPETPASENAADGKGGDSGPDSPPQEAAE